MNNLKKFLLNPFAALAVGVIANVTVAMAATPTPPTIVKTQSDLQTLLCNITGWFFWVVITISVIMIVYAAFTYATAGSDTEKTSKARRTITYAAVGIAVALLAYGLPAVIADFFSGIGSGVQQSTFGCVSL